MASHTRRFDRAMLDGGDGVYTALVDHLENDHRYPPQDWPPEAYVAVQLHDDIHARRSFRHQPRKTAAPPAARCNCRGEILPHPSDPGNGCPPDWEAVRLLPRRNMVQDGPWCDPRAAKPLGWDCAACGAFSRDIPLSAGWDRVAADYDDHRAGSCPERVRGTAAVGGADGPTTERTT